jgi:hypothetical protein
MSGFRLACIILVLASSRAVAQDSNAESPLAGPKVRQTRPPMLEEGMGMRAGKDRMAGQGIPPREFARIIAALGSGDVAPSLRLTSEQQQKIAAIEGEVRARVREQARQGQQGGPAGRAGKGDVAKGEADKGETAGPQRPAARMEEIRRAGVSPADVQTRVWVILTEPQQKYVQAEAEKVRKQMDERQNQQYVDRELQKRRAGQAQGPADATAPERPADAKAAPAPAAEARPGDAGAQRERFRRLAERLAQLPPEEREQILKRIEQELDRRGVPAEGAAPLNRPGRAGARTGGGESKPAPKIDDVKVPKPDGRS